MNPIETQQQVVSDDGSLAKYFSMMPHIDDDDLDPYEYRLLGHYRKQCGLSPTKVCTESTSTTAKRTKMSAAKVRTARANLVVLGRIEVSGELGQTVHVRLKDCMAENLARYAKPTPHESMRGGLTNPLGGDSRIRETLKNIKKKKEESSREPIGASLFSQNQSYQIVEDEPYVAPIAVK